ncbi:MAG: Rpn family recombination-promoting nuclease/putative transposase [Treponema sp.]|nr:Rpn family recombination-promoting nuclease/putative transposase [Treponema sp.]
MDLIVNRNHKDSVFSKLFSDPEILRELYSAISGVDIPPDAIIDINTLSEALFMNRINDLSFAIDDKIVVLIEHQSTVNYNIPIRLLMYIGRVYEKIIDKKNIYHRKLIKIPAPEFIVLYNGKDEYPDYQELRLSASFKETSGLKNDKKISPPLELIVQVYNINQGRNPDILNKSANLNGYSLLMGKIKEFSARLPLAESVRAAVKYCIERDVLKRFLENIGSEIINMLFEDITIEEIAEIRGEERYEEGLEQGTKNERQRLLELFNLGLPIEEIKKILDQ